MPSLFRNKIFYNPQRLLEKINMLNGKVACTTSLYSFNSVMDRRPVWESAVFNKILFVTDLDNLRKLAYHYKGKDYEMMYVGDGEFYFLLFTEVFQSLNKTARVFESIIKDHDIHAQVNYLVNKQIYFQNTYNPNSKSWVIPLMEDDLTTLEDIEELAIKPRQVDRITGRIEKK